MNLSRRRLRISCGLSGCNSSGVEVSAEAEVVVVLDKEDGLAATEVDDVTSLLAASSLEVTEVAPFKESGSLEFALSAAAPTIGSAACDELGSGADADSVAPACCGVAFLGMD